MARRRAKAAKPVEEPEPEPEVEVEQEDMSDVAPEPQDEQSDSELSEPQDEIQDIEEDAPEHVLQFDEELTWRPAKPIPTSTLYGRLERLAEELKGYEQGEVDLDSLEDVKNNLVHRQLVQHKDPGVKAYTACCIIDMLRLYAPDAPYTDDQLKMIFTLFIKDILPALHDPKSSYNSQHVYVLTQLTEVEIICLVNQVPGRDELMTRLFNSTFDGVSTSSKSTDGELAKDVEFNLTNMLVQLLDEAKNEVPSPVVDAIISQFMRAAPPGGERSKGQSSSQSTLLHKKEPPAYVMAKHICNELPDVMARCVTYYFSETILGASEFAIKAKDADDEDAITGPSEADLKSLRQSHMLIRELWRAAPAVLQNVVPQLDAELAADDPHLRQIAAETFGDMISGIGAAGPPPPPALEPALYPPISLGEDLVTSAVEPNALTTPHCTVSFIQSHPSTYRSFVGRKNDKNASIRASWATAAGYILSTSAGGIGLNRVEENELIQSLADLLLDSEEKVRLAAVKAVEVFEFRDIVTKLGSVGGVDKEGSLLSNLAHLVRDKRSAVRVEAMVLLGKLWAVGTGEIAEGSEAVTTCLGGIPARILDAAYANDADVNVLLDRVLHECLVPLKFPTLRGKGSKSGSSSQSKTLALSQPEQDQIRVERILLMIKSLNERSRRAFIGLQTRRPNFAAATAGFIKQCEDYNGGIAVKGNKASIEQKMNEIIKYVAALFPGPPEKVRNDMLKVAKSNNRRVYQLMKFSIETDSDFQKVRRSLNELIAKLQEGNAASSLDTLIPLLYRSSNIIYNKSHLTPIMEYSKSNKLGLASVAHLILTEISTLNPDLFKTHAEELRKSIEEDAPSDSRSNDESIRDILKAYSSYVRKYPENIKADKSFNQTLMSYALYGTPHQVAKYAVSILLVKQDERSKVTATQLLQKIMKGLDYGKPHFLSRLAAISQLQRLAPSVTADFEDELHELTIKKILRQVQTEAKPTDPSWVPEAELDEEIQAKCLCLRIQVNRAIANVEAEDAQDRIKPLFKLLRTFVVEEGEFCKVKDTPQHHKKHLRLLAAKLILKLCTFKKYDDQFDAVSFNKLAEMVQDSEVEVRRRFLEKLQSYLTQGRIRPRFYAIFFLVAFEPVEGLKLQIETWIRSRCRYYEENKRRVLEGTIARLIPLLVHHPDFSKETEDLKDFAKYFLFHLSTVATEENLPLISKYTERVKQTRDALSPESSENMYILCDLASATIRKYQERQGWSFQAWPEKVGLPTGLFTALPSSEVAQQVAKKQYIPDSMDETLDELIRAQDRKKVCRG